VALVSLSGETTVTSDNDVWCGIAMVMERVGANIQDAAGTFMRNDKVSKSESCGGEWSFSAHPFGTRLTPMGAKMSDEGSDTFAIALLVKASIPEANIQLMSHILHTTFPRLVCTVTYGAHLNVEGNDAAAALVAGADGQEGAPRPLPEDRFLTGTIRLFGPDKVGQLATIAAVLAQCSVSILNLLVTTGFGDRDTYEFLDRAGGPLSENVISVAAFDRAAFDEARFKEEVTEAAKRVGYTAISIVVDAQANRARVREELADYYLSRKSSIRDYIQNTDTNDLSWL